MYAIKNVSQTKFENTNKYEPNLFSITENDQTVDGTKYLRIIDGLDDYFKLTSSPKDSPEISTLTADVNNIAFEYMLTEATAQKTSGVKAKLQQMFEPITKEFFRELEFDRFDSRYTSKTEIVIKSILQCNKEFASEWLQYMFSKYICDSSVLVALLHTLSHLHYDEVGYTVSNLPMNAYINNDPYVREYVIRCYEKWQNKDTLNVLKMYYKNTDLNWLQEYIDDVISDIEAGD